MLALALLYARRMRHHTRLPRLSISLLVVCSLTAVAAADDLAVPDSRPQRRLAVATDPIGLLSGHYALSATYVATRHFAVRADMQIIEEPWAYADSSWRAGISVPIYLDRPLHGPYVEPGLAFAERLTGYAYGGIGSLGGTSGDGLGGLGGMATFTPVPLSQRSIEPQIFVGWQWLFDSGLNIAAAVGVSRHTASDGSGTSTAVRESYLRVGIAL